MKTIKTLLTAILTIGLMFSCQPGTPEDNTDKTPTPNTELSVRVVNMLHLPFEVTSSNRVNVSAKITVLNGQLSNVQLYYTVTEGNIQGEEQIIEMSATSVGYYECNIPAQAGDAIVKYWIAVNGTNLNSEPFEYFSDMGNYIVTKDENEGGEGGDDKPGDGDDPIITPVDPLSKIRLNEISTGASIGEYIEIYNTSAEEINLDGLCIYKNLDYEEPLITIEDKSLAPYGYGILTVKGASFVLPEGCIILGDTDRGLASSRALCVELGRDGGATIYDTYTNTINPYTDATDWNTDAVELEAKFVARFTDGWYSAGIRTPGDKNLDAVTKLKHQKIVALAVSDAPYVARMGFDPTSVCAGQSLKVYADVYTDAYSTISTVTCSVAGSTITLNKVGDYRYEGAYRFDSQGDYVATTTATNSDNRNFSLDNKVMVQPEGTKFAPQAAVRLNEIDADRKFIEFYNTSANPVNLVGMYVEKNNEDILVMINDNIVLKGHGFAVLACAGKDYSSSEYLYLGSSEKGISGKKSLCLEWMATIPEKVRIDAFCNTKDTDPRPKVTLWDDPASIETSISNNPAARYKDGVVAIPELANQWFIVEKSSIGASNNSVARKGRLRNQMVTILPVPEEE